MPSKSVRKIFDKFYRVTDNDKIRDIPGTGLGLPLVKQIVEMHSGHIDVESELDRGSIFSVFLPRLNSQQAVLVEQDDFDEIIH